MRFFAFLSTEKAFSRVVFTPTRWFSLYKTENESARALSGYLEFVL